MFIINSIMSSMHKDAWWCFFNWPALQYAIVCYYDYMLEYFSLFISRKIFIYWCIFYTSLGSFILLIGLIFLTNPLKHAISLSITLFYILKLFLNNHYFITLKCFTTVSPIVFLWLYLFHSLASLQIQLVVVFF